MDIQNLKEIVGCGLSAGELIASLSNGFGFDDVKPALETAKRIPAAAKDAKLALAEYQNMSDTQAMELEEFVQNDFDIANDVLELAIEKAINLVISLHELAQLIPVPVKA